MAQFRINKRDFRPQMYLACFNLHTLHPTATILGNERTNVSKFRFCEKHVVPYCPHPEWYTDVTATLGADMGQYMRIVLMAKVNIQMKWKARRQSNIYMKCVRLLLVCWPFAGMLKWLDICDHRFPQGLTDYPFSWMYCLDVIRTWYLSKHNVQYLSELSSQIFY